MQNIVYLFADHNFQNNIISECDVCECLAGEESCLEQQHSRRNWFAFSNIKKTYKINNINKIKN